MIAGLRDILYRRRLRMLDAARRLDATTGPEAIEARQVARFNAIWGRCVAALPFYRAWAREHRLPPHIARTVELLDFPILTKQVIVDRSDEIFQGGRLKHGLSTGGSTGVPARFPTDATGSDNNWAALYLARGWWGITPFDRQLLIWGHSHLFGTGRRRLMALAARLLADRLINAHRRNAYDMTPEAIARCAAVLSRLRPDFIVGYTSAIFRLARHLEEAGSWPPRVALKGVILTSETATPADIDVIGRVFAAPVILEYGAAETGVIAYSRPGDDPMHLRLLWDSQIAVNDGGSIRVTTISDRIFPLINYDTGDRTRPGHRQRETVLSFAGIEGRAQDLVRIHTVRGQPRDVSAIMLVHILRADPAVRSVAFEQRWDGLVIHVEGAVDLAALAALFTREMSREHPGYDAAATSFVATERPLLSPAGKHLLMRPPAP